MDHRFFTLQQPTFQQQQRPGTQKNHNNASRKALKPIKKPGEDIFKNEKQKQTNHVFNTNMNDWALQRTTFVDPPEKMSTLPLPPQETEIQIYKPKNSNFIEPSDDELQELPDIPSEKNWPDLTQNSSDTSYNDSIIED